MANYSPAWRAHAAGARLVQCLQGLGRGRGLDALAHEADPKAVQEPKHRGGDNQQQPKKKKKGKEKKKNKGLANWVPSVPTLQTNVAVQVWVAGAASRPPACPTDVRKKNRKTRKKRGTHQRNSTFKPSWGRPSLTT